MTRSQGIGAVDASYDGNTTLISYLSKSNVPKVGCDLEQQVRHLQALDSYPSPQPDP